MLLILAEHTVIIESATLSNIILLILEILQRAALIMGLIYLIDLTHNGKIDLYLPNIKRLKKGFIYRFFMKIADKLESGLEARKRAWEFRAR